jgi:hypothetical protein
MAAASFGKKGKVGRTSSVVKIHTEDRPRIPARILVPIRVQLAGSQII